MLSRLLSGSRVRVRARPRVVVACAMLAAGVVGCSATGTSNVSVTGAALTIYASSPADAASTQQAADVLDAERLAFRQKQSEVTAFKLSFHTLGSAKLSNNARTAIQDTRSIAYLGELSPGSSADSIGITNAQQLLQVTPSDTALELTQATSAVPGAPGRYYEQLSSYGRTFARVVASSAQEARAQVQELQSLAVRRLYVTDDGSSYGRAIALAVKSDASPAITVVSSQRGADAMFYGANNVGAAIRTFTSAAQANPTVKLFGPSALAVRAFAAGLPAGVRNVYVSAPGFLPRQLPHEGQRFVADFEATYQHSPATQAIFGYEAMGAVLDVLKEAGSAANNRSTVVHDFFAIKNRSSPLGTYSINANGDMSFAPFIFSRVRAGTLVPFKSVQVQG
jgi:ABC-type branched-subunit amino acid transport system substrate-binding protein